MPRYPRAWSRRQLLHRAIVAGAAVLACGPPSEPRAPSRAAAAASDQPTPTDPENAAPPVPAPLTDIRQATLGIMGEAAAFVALERGYFAAEGLAIEVVNARAADQILLGLTSGQIMVFPAPLSPAIFNALARGFPSSL